MHSHPVLHFVHKSREKFKKMQKKLCQVRKFCANRLGPRPRPSVGHGVALARSAREWL